MNQFLFVFATSCMNSFFEKNREKEKKRLKHSRYGRCARSSIDFAKASVAVFRETIRCRCLLTNEGGDARRSPSRKAGTSDKNKRKLTCV